MVKVKSTAEIPIAKMTVDQVIGQEDAVKLIKKAAEQRRHVLLIGEPGTGKSMLGLALAELLPKERLVDIVAFPNPNDENTPLIRTVPAGKGRDLVMRTRLESGNVFKYQSIFFIVLAIVAAVFLPMWAFDHYSKIPGGTPLLGGLMFVGFFLGGAVLLAGLGLFLNINRRADSKIRTPKTIVDNF